MCYFRSIATLKPICCRAVKSKLCVQFAIIKFCIVRFFDDLNNIPFDPNSISNWLLLRFSCAYLFLLIVTGWLEYYLPPVKTMFGGLK